MSFDFRADKKEVLYIRRLFVHPKGKLVDDHLSIFLHAVNPVSLLPGWRRRASYRLVLLNQSGKELQRTAGIDMIISSVMFLNLWCDYT